MPCGYDKSRIKNVVVQRIVFSTRALIEQAKSRAASGTDHTKTTYQLCLRASNRFGVAHCRQIRTLLFQLFGVLLCL